MQHKHKKNCSNIKKIRDYYMTKIKNLTRSDLVRNKQVILKLYPFSHASGHFKLDYLFSLDVFLQIRI